MATYFGAPEGQSGGTIFADSNASKPNILQSAVKSGEDSIKAAGFMLGMVQAETPEQAATYRRRFFADAAALGVGAATGGVGSVLAKGVGPIARAIIASALGGAGGGAAFEAVEGGDIGQGALTGAVGGALFGLPLGKMLGGKGAALADDVLPDAPRIPSKPDVSVTRTRPFGEPQGELNPQPPIHVRGEQIAQPFGDVRPQWTPSVDDIESGLLPVDQIARPDDVLQFEAKSPQVIASGISPSAVAEEFGTLADARAALKAMTTPRTQARRTTRPSRIARPTRTAFADEGVSKLEALRMELESRPAMEIVGANNRMARALTKLPGGDRMASIFDDATKFFNRAIVASSDAMNKMGPFGQRLATMMSTTLDKAARTASEDVRAIQLIGRKYTTAQRHKISDILNGTDVATDLAMQRDVELLRERLDRVARGAVEGRVREYVPSSNTIRKFEYRQDYFPLTYTDKTVKRLMTDGPEREAVLRKLVEQGQAADRGSAEALLKRHFQTPAEFRYGHLQVARELALPGFERDFMKVLPLYFMRSWKRIETAKTFGPQDEGAAYLIKQLKEQGHDFGLAFKAYEAFADKAPLDYQDLIRATKSFNVISLLSTAGLVQLSQHSNTIAYAGFKNYMKGLGAMYTKEGRGWAAETGAYMQELVQDLVPFGDQSATGKWLNMIGMTPLDKNNRIIAALAGRYQAADVARQLVAKPQDATLRRTIVQMGLTPDEVLAQRGVLNNEQLRIAGQQVSHITQFRGSPLDLPVLKNTTAGQFVYLFKSFSLQQMRFVGVLMDEAKKGNIAPAMRYLGATGTLSAAVGETVRYLRGRPEADDPAWGYFEAALNSGAIGIAGDALRSANNGPEFFAKFLAGPSASQIFDLFGRDLPALAAGKPEVILHDALSHTPGIGKQLADYLIPLGE